VEFDLRSHTILLTLAGSRAYGLHTEESDVDVKGVCIPPAIYLTGCFKRFDQADKPSHMEPFTSLLSPDLRAAVEHEKLEGTVYAIQKFMKLASDANPNILDVLFCRDSEVLFQTDAGKTLRENREMFISKKAFYTFRGYAKSQLSRILTHRAWLLSPVETKPQRADFGLSEDKRSLRTYRESKSAIRKRMDQWAWDFGDLPDSEIIRLKSVLSDTVADMVTSDSDEWARAGRSLGMTDELLEKLQAERAYDQAMQNWKQYQDWKRRRNPKRAAMEAESGYDRKHAMHLVRLYRTGAELLSTGKVNIWREDRDELLAVRNGAYSYDEMMSLVKKEDDTLQELVRTNVCVVPNKPDREKIEQLCSRLVLQSLSV